jgi:hypothetical protein
MTVNSASSLLILTSTAATTVLVFQTELISPISVELVFSRAILTTTTA